MSISGSFTRDYTSRMPRFVFESELDRHIFTVQDSLDLANVFVHGLLNTISMMYFSSLTSG